MFFWFSLKCLKSSRKCIKTCQNAQKRFVFIFCLQHWSIFQVDNNSTRAITVPGAADRSPSGTGGCPGVTPGGGCRIIILPGAANRSRPHIGGFWGATPGGGSRIVTVPGAASRSRPDTSGFPGATLGGGP